MVLMQPKDSTRRTGKPTFGSVLHLRMPLSFLLDQLHAHMQVHMHAQTSQTEVAEVLVYETKTETLDNEWEQK